MSKAHFPTFADEPDDRVSRLLRALRASTHDVAHDCFVAEADRLHGMITRKEEEMRRHVQQHVHSTSQQVQSTYLAELAVLHRERDKMLRYHADRLDMIYRTMRDVYNQDAGEEAHVGVEQQ
jgi:ubiquinone biosynthesis protein COQ9